MENTPKSSHEISEEEYTQNNVKKTAALSGGYYEHESIYRSLSDDVLENKNKTIHESNNRIASEVSLETEAYLKGLRIGRGTKLIDPTVAGSMFIFGTVFAFTTGMLIAKYRR